LKVTINWLKELVDFSLSAKELANALTMIGLEVEEYYQAPRNFINVVTGKILSASKHPDASHLSLCTVDIGAQKLTVVCGAPNATEGMLAPFAVEGAILADGNKVEARSIRGYESRGMLCSEAELGLSDRADGLMVLPENTPVGKDLNAVLGEPDVTLDIAITPNRPDCMSVIGIAREVAAIVGAQLRKPAVSLKETPEHGENPVCIEIRDKAKCFRYSGRMLWGIHIMPSPYWMAARLHAVGVRSINNVVDIGNYVMMETGQPLHAFDYRFLEGDRIIVRTASEKERFITLDGQEHTLDNRALLICDAAKPVALAGIMGGLNSEIQPDTETVFLESAYFEPIGTRRTSKKLDLSSESSRRFERGIDPNGTIYAMNRAAQLMVELADGRVAGQVVDEYPQRVTPVEIDLSVKATNNLLGTSLPGEKISAILASLEVTQISAKDDRLTFQVPTLRPDLTREVDLIEEIARHYGYDNIAFAPSAPVGFFQGANERVIFKDQTRKLLAGSGFKETVSLSLVNSQWGGAFLPGEGELVELLNPLSPELSVFRPNLVLSLLTNVTYNRNRQIQNLRLFEIGDVAWRKQNKGAIAEKCQVAGVLAGKRLDQTWYQKAESFDYYDIKGAVEALLRNIGIAEFEQEKSADSFWDTTCSNVKASGQYIGAFGKVSREICSLFKIKIPDVFAFYLDFDFLYEHRKKQREYSPIPRYPSVPFDLALVIDSSIPISAIEQEIRKSGGPYLAKVDLFDYYQGEQVQQGKKSTAFSLTFSSKERTLEEEEVERAVTGILKHLKSLLGAELRLK
jgi:phenylalanyl-tRNA synthetase beta chain